MYWIESHKKWQIASPAERTSAFLLLLFQIILFYTCLSIPQSVCLTLLAFFSSITLQYLALCLPCIMFTSLHKRKQIIYMKIYHKCTEQNRKSAVDCVLCLGSRGLCNSISDFMMSLCENLMFNCSMPLCIAFHNFKRLHT